MTFVRQSFPALYSISAVALLVACGVPESAPIAGQAFVAHSARANARSGQQASWIANGAVSQDLLYVSDEGTNDVYIYSWPQGKLVGTLTGISYPQGECVDAAGNVFVTSIGASLRSHIYEYAHGGTKRIAKLNELDVYPHGCAIDPTTGNLAITNLENVHGGPGNVAIYKHARHLLGSYQAPQKYYYFFCGYDKAGNLFADAGGNISNEYGLTELPVGGTAMIDVSLNQTIYYPGAVQWDGQYVAVGDTAANEIYQFSVSGSSGSLASATQLDDASDVLQFWIENGAVAGANAGSATVMYWKYPAGGKETHTITGLTDPVGVVVSKHKIARRLLAANTVNEEVRHRAR
jgi:hypothetical protein